ncbi:suppressor of cytokine signaling 1 [Ambystoma mexicanum]|uniref:suppressor of cytokine signaling 1 n=1 Tax=Ambystoma mexicanum TaxID=8296 RepID=UPI0037E7EEF7
MVAHSKVADNADTNTNVRLPLLDLQALDRCPISLQQCQPRPVPPRARHAPATTHFRTFRSHSDFRIITQTCARLEDCSFYWGPMTVNEAHEKLTAEPAGTFLIRDSKQINRFFAISVQTATGPISVRVSFQAGRFSLDGSKESFDCLFKLVEHYLTSPKKLLVTPLRKVRLRTLQELCRKSIVTTFGGENLDQLPLNPVLKDYLKSFPFQI